MLLIGSCFVENIGEKVEYYKFQNLVNPFGILFHPEAIARFFEFVVDQKVFAESDLFEIEERFISLDAHSELSAATSENALIKLNASIQQTQDCLKTASHIVITLGTAWGYRHKDQNKIVANCHKIPQKEFEKELASVSEVEDALNRILKAIRRKNSEGLVLFTVSPVRHTKDGFIENQRSKAHLITAIHSVLENAEKAEYFPSYEIMMDELRDYRFYDRDLLHPNALAVDYIWERFASVYFSSDTRKIAREVDEIQKGLSHRPFNPDSKAHHKFLEKLQRKKEDLRKLVPRITFQDS